MSLRAKKNRRWLRSLCREGDWASFRANSKSWRDSPLTETAARAIYGERVLELPLLHLKSMIEFASWSDQAQRSFAFAYNATWRRQGWSPNNEDIVFLARPVVGESDNMVPSKPKLTKLGLDPRLLGA